MLSRAVAEAFPHATIDVHKLTMDVIALKGKGMSREDAVQSAIADQLRNAEH